LTAREALIVDWHLNLPEPTEQWVRTGENLGHQLQVGGSKGLKSATYFGSRTAAPRSDVTVPNLQVTL